MKKFKNIFISVLLILYALTLFCGCQSDNNQAETENTPASTDSTSGSTGESSG